MNHISAGNEPCTNPMDAFGVPVFVNGECLRFFTDSRFFCRRQMITNMIMIAGRHMQHLRGCAGVCDRTAAKPRAYRSRV